MTEQWKPIKGYEGIYEVSNLGRVKSVTRMCWNGSVWWKKPEQMIKPQPSHKRNNYVYIGLCKHGKPKTLKLHRLVATAFVPNPHDYPQVNHKDENVLNNTADNLEWVTAQQNCDYGNHNCNLRDSVRRSAKFKAASKLREKKVAQIEGTNVVKVWNSVTEAARKTGCSESAISMCCTGVRNTHHGFRWQYL